MSMLSHNKLPAAVLAAYLLGLLFTPYIYIAIGALSGFSAAFSYLMLPPLIAASTFLLWCYLVKPETHVNNKFKLTAEVISWLFILFFLFVISGFTLQTDFEQLGMSSSFSILAFVCCLPLTLLRETTLEKRLSQFPVVVTISIVSILLTISAVIMIKYLMSTPVFI